MEDPEVPKNSPTSTDAHTAELMDELERAEEDLNPRQATFVQEFIIDNNGSQAALRAGYSEFSAGQTAAALIKNPKIARAIAAARAQRAARTGITQDTVLHEMSLLGLSSLDHYEITSDGQVRPTAGAPVGAMRAIQSIKKKTRIRIDRSMDPPEEIREYDVEVRLWDKPQPLKLLGRHVGLFPDRQEHTGKNGGPIETVTRIERVIIDPKVDDAPK